MTLKVSPVVFNKRSKTIGIDDSKIGFGGNSIFSLVCDVFSVIPFPYIASAFDVSYPYLFCFLSLPHTLQILDEVTRINKFLTFYEILNNTNFRRLIWFYSGKRLSKTSFYNCNSHSCMLLLLYRIL